MEDHFTTRYGIIHASNGTLQNRSKVYEFKMNENHYVASILLGGLFGTQAADYFNTNWIGNMNEIQRNKDETSLMSEQYWKYWFRENDEYFLTNVYKKAYKQPGATCTMSILHVQSRRCLVLSIGDDCGFRFTSSVTDKSFHMEALRPFLISDLANLICNYLGKFFFPSFPFFFFSHFVVCFVYCVINK
jgi:hypothetical protein